MTCDKFPSGFFFFLLLCVLVLVSSLPVNGQTVTISEITWNGLKVESARLNELSATLVVSLSESSTQIDALRENWKMLEYDLEKVKGESMILSGQLSRARAQVEQLRIQLDESQTSLRKVNANVRKTKINNLLIGGAVGLAAGVIIGLLAGG